jgi:hypothetical protein
MQQTVHGLDVAQRSFVQVLKHTKRILTHDSRFDGAWGKVRKVLSVGHCQTSSVDLLEKKSELNPPPHTHTIHVRQADGFFQDKTQDISECIAWGRGNEADDG